MLYPDTETGRKAVRERQAELKRDWQRANPARPDLVESRRRQRRLQLRWLRAHLRPASHMSWTVVDRGHSPSGWSLPQEAVSRMHHGLLRRARRRRRSR